MAEVGQTYEVEVVEEMENQWTGPLGIARIGDVDVPVPNAKKGQKFTVRVTGVETNQWTSRKQASFEVVQ